MIGSRFEVSFRLLALNAKLFREIYKLDIAVFLVGLLYVFGGQSQLKLTVGKGIFLLAVLLFIALMASQIIKNNAANLIFYLRLPIGKIASLALFYVALVLPILAIFTAIFLLTRTLCFPREAAMLTQRFFQVTIAILFLKSMTINSMIAMSIHFALIAGYFVFLGAVLVFLSIMKELLVPLLIMSDGVFALLFLLSTYLISFIAVKKIGL